MDLKLMIENLIDWRTRMTVLVPLPICQLEKKRKKRSSVEIGTCQTDRPFVVHTREDV